MPAAGTADQRYERHVRPLPHPVRRVCSTWPWQPADGLPGWLVHLEHVGADDAPVRLLLVHGAGGNAAAMWPFAAHLSTLGARVTLVDLPGYGHTTQTAGRPGSERYPHWQQLLLDLVEREDDDRPLVLLGASMGGMLAVDTAARSGRVDRVIVTCLLDTTRPAVRRAMVRAPWLAALGLPLLRLARGPLARVRLPVRWLTPMAAIANSPGLARDVLADPRGGGGSMPLGWFRSVVSAGPAVPPGEYAGPPVLLVHPEEDRWTPPELSEAFLARLAGPTRAVWLRGCGHFPVEEPGFQELLDQAAAEIAAARDQPR